MLRHAWVWLVVGAVVALVGVDAAAQNQPEGQLTIAFDTAIAPTYLDPAETTGIAAPFVFLYALHDALRVEEPGVGLIPLFAYFGPYEEMRLQKPCRAAVPPCAHAVAQRRCAL